MTTNDRSQDASPSTATPGTPEDDRQVALGKDLAHPEQIVAAAGDAPSSQGPHGADAVGSARPPRPEGPGPEPAPGDSDAPLPAAATGDQRDVDATDLDGSVTEHSATPGSWQRDR